MSSPSRLHCDACGIAGSGTANGDDMPDGWRFTRLECFPVLLCAACAPALGHALAVTPELCHRLAARGAFPGLCMQIWGIGAGENGPRPEIAHRV